jgi:serine/alanine adding enzyme
MRVVDTLDQKIWESYVQRHPLGNIFHSPEMFQVYANTEGYTPSLWAVEGANSQILSLMLPVQVKLSPSLSALTTRAVVFGSILYEEGREGREALNLLLKTYTEEIENPPLFTELRNLSDYGSVQPIFLDRDFVYEEHLNYLVDISQPADVIFQKIGRRTRKNIRRGLNREIVLIEQVIEHGQFSTCIDLIQKTYLKARVPLAHPTLFENAFEILSPKKMVRVTMASVEGQPAATSIELLFKDVVYGWYSGLDRSYSAYIPNELLMWDILKWGTESSFHVDDFGGAGKPGEEYGVRDFKAKFGGELVCFGRNTYIHRPGLFHLSKAGYRVYQSVKGLG